MLRWECLILLWQTIGKHGIANRNLSDEELFSEEANISWHIFSASLK